MKACILFLFYMVMFVVVVVGQFRDGGSRDNGDDGHYCAIVFHKRLIC